MILRRALRPATCAIFMVHLSGCCFDSDVFSEFSEGFEERLEKGEKEPKPQTGAPPKQAKGSEAAQGDGAPKTEMPSSKGTFEKKKFAKGAVPGSINVRGDVVDGLRFRDANGDNFLVLSQKGPDLHAVHAVVDGSDTEVLRTVAQKKRPCEFDYMSQFEPRATKATDLDGDGYGEATFAYRYTCASDVAPWNYKLLVLENGDKAILRGHDSVKMGEDQWGDTGFEPDGFDGSPKLLNHATETWYATAAQK